MPTKDNSVTCCTCDIKYTDNDAYLAHVCTVTGYVPTDAKHHGSQFLSNQKASLKRGKSLTKAREAKIDADIAEVRTKGIDHKISTKKSETIMAERKARIEGRKQKVKVVKK